MLVIDDHTETHLHKALETSDENSTQRFLYFPLAANPEHQPFVTLLKPRIIDAVQTLLAAHDPRLYFCKDGDIFLLGAIPAKEARQTMLAIAELFNVPAHESFCQLGDVRLHRFTLLRIVEQKLEQDQLASHQALLAQEQQQVERKRQAILEEHPFAQEASVAERRRLRKHRELMIIEDDPFSRRLVENVLHQHYKLTALSSAEHALSTYARLAPDVLFLDINLPDVSGHELLEKLIALDPDAYIVMLSGNADKENIMTAMHRGAKGFAAKPFSRDKLFQYIDRCPTIHIGKEAHAPV